MHLSIDCYCSSFNIIQSPYLHNILLYCMCNSLDLVRFAQPNQQLNFVWICFGCLVIVIILYRWFGLFSDLKIQTPNAITYRVSSDEYVFMAYERFFFFSSFCRFAFINVVSIHSGYSLLTTNFMCVYMRFVLLYIKETHMRIPHTIVFLHLIF